MRDAIVIWSGIDGTVLRMVEGGPADINCSGPNATVASADGPTANYRPGPIIRVNSYWNTCANPPLDCLVQDQKLHNMVHELGHTIGFRHTNHFTIGDQAGTQGVWQIGTMTTDQFSVMNGNTGLWNFQGLTLKDSASTRILYPVMPVITVTDQGYGNSIIISWTRPPRVTSFDINYCTLYVDEYEGAPYSYYTCGGPTQTDTTWATLNEGQTSCAPYFVLRARYPEGASTYWSSEINIDGDCPYN